MSKKIDKAIKIFQQDIDSRIEDVAKQVGCSERSAYRAKKRARKLIKQQKKVKQSFTVDESADTTKLNSTNFRSKNTDRAIILEEFLKLCQIDMSTYETKQVRIGASDVTMSGAKSSTDEDTSYRNYNISVILIPVGKSLSPKQRAEEFAEAIAKHKPVKYKPIKHVPAKNGNAAVISIHDLHYGSLCWGPETGTDYDINIAEDTYLEAVENLASYIALYNPEVIVFPVGSDFFNVNSKLNITANGTLQDEDSRWMKTYVLGREMAIKAIDRLRHIAPVNSIIIRGNHDEERAFSLGDSLYCWYNQCPDVLIDNGPTLRKYWGWDNCLLGFTHGKEEKKGKLPEIMALETKATYWSKAKYCEFEVGHWHHFTVSQGEYGTEESAVRVRYMPALAATDSWHKGKGLSGLRAAEAAIWNKDKGNIARFSYSP